MSPMALDLIEMRHPDLDEVVKVTEREFLAYAASGWERVDPKPAKPPRPSHQDAPSPEGPRAEEN